MIPRIKVIFLTYSTQKLSLTNAKSVTTREIQENIKLMLTFSPQYFSIHHSPRKLFFDFNEKQISRCQGELRPETWSENNSLFTSMWVWLQVTAMSLIRRTESLSVQTTGDMDLIRGLWFKVLISGGKHRPFPPDLGVLIPLGARCTIYSTLWYFVCISSLHNMLPLINPILTLKS